MLTYSEQKKLMAELSKLCKAASEGESRILNFIELHQDAVIDCWIPVDSRACFASIPSETDDVLAPKVTDMIAKWKAHHYKRVVPQQTADWQEAQEVLINSMARVEGGALRLGIRELLRCCMVAKELRSKYMVLDFGDYKLAIEVARLHHVLSTVKKLDYVNVFIKYDPRRLLNVSLAVRWLRTVWGRTTQGGINLELESFGALHWDYQREAVYVSLGFAPANDVAA